MRNFLKIVEGIDVKPLLNALAVRPYLWNENTLRTAHPASPHRQVDDIWCMFNAIPNDPTQVVDDCDVVPYRAWHEIPLLRPVILDLMRRVEGVRLGRVIISRLDPGKMIEPHVDQGAPATYYDRYHLVLQSQPGVLTQAGEEVIEVYSGDFLWFNNRVPHQIVNNSADDRIALVMDVRRC